MTTWEDFENGDNLDEWFYVHLLDQGAREIPEGAFTWVDGKFKPQVTVENEKEIRAYFKDDIEFECFKA